MRRSIAKCALAALGAFSCVSCLAQDFPSRPVRIVVPFSPGGNLDVTTRIVAESMSQDLGQPFVVENRPGAGGVVGSEAVAGSAPDGYTLVAGTTATTIVSPLLVARSSYELKSFAPVGMMAITPLMLEVSAAGPYRDYKGFVAHARAHPGRVTMGHSGNGTTNHIAVLRLQQALKVSFNVVPYKGSGPALIDLVGGQIDSAIDQSSSSLAHVRAGKLRVLAVATRERIAELPDVPTLRELGLKDFEAVTPSGLFAPATTPSGIVKILHGALHRALADPAVRKRLEDLGSEVRPLSTEQFDRFLREEEARLKGLVRSGVLKAE